ncbi:MAG TPA: hypothetical protein VFP84_03845 [Kofleriaceae bacterium]|nr:hypothetical protein [Kofleriaceae bacterium]
MNFSTYSYNSIPTNPDGDLWYASWSTTDNTVVWSQAKPSLIPDGVSTWVMGIVALSSSGKQLPPLPALSADSEASFKYAFNAWAASLRHGHLAD